MEDYKAMENNNVNRNAIDILVHNIETSKKIFSVVVLLATIEIIVITYFTIEHWNDDCDQPFNYIIACNLILECLATIHYIMNFFSRINEDEMLKYLSDKCKRWIMLFDLVLFIVQIVYMNKSDTCSNVLYTIMLYELILKCIKYTLPILMLVLICCCSPCLVLLIYMSGHFGNTGAPQEIVNELELLKYEDTDKTIDECGICISKYENTDKLRKLPCKHLFHKDCVDNWLVNFNKTCPFCRADITINNIPDNIV